MIDYFSPYSDIENRDYNEKAKKVLQSVKEKFL